MIGAYILAVVSSLGTLAFMSGAFGKSIRTVDDVYIYRATQLILIFAPSLIGMALGFSAIERKRPTPVHLWAATTWNGVILGKFVLTWTMSLFRI